MKKMFTSLFLLIFSIIILLPTGSVTAQEFNLRSYIVMDAQTGYVMYEKNADIPLPPASITKAMTMYLIFEALEKGQITLDEKVTAGPRVKTAQTPGAQTLFLEPGHQVSVRELLTTIAVPSANDAAVAMAERIAGSEMQFVAMMNDKARELGLTNTLFQNSHGLDTPNHYMSARDIAILSQRLINDFPQVLEFSSIETYRTREQTNHWGETLFYESTFRTLLRKHKGIIDGLKTGYTEEAGRCITATAIINGRRVIIVLMGAESVSQRDNYIEQFMTKIVTDFRSVNVAQKENPIEEIPIPRAKNKLVQVGTLNDVNLMVPNVNPDVIQQIVINEGVRAPLNKGDEVGKVMYYIGEQLVYETAIYTLEDVPQANIIVRFFRGIGNLFSKLFNLIF